MRQKLVMMTTALLCAFAQGAWAENVTFNVRSWNDANKEVVTADDTKDATIIEGNHPDDWIGLENGYYVAKGTVNYKVLNIMGNNVHLILADGCQLNCKHIKLEEGKTLHIHSQSDDETTRGRLSAENKKAGMFGSNDAVYIDAAPIGGSKKANMGSLYVHLYDYTDSWTWADDASSVALTLHCDVIDTDEHYTTNNGVTISEPEDLTDNGNVYGQRYMARFTFTKNGYEYRFGSLQNVMNRLTIADITKQQ